MISANEKVDIVFATLATSIYRRWYWSQYKSPANQAALRTEWIKVLGRFTAYEIRQGLKSWATQFGEDTPPSPSAFADFIKPVHSAASLNGFKSIRQALGNTT